MGCSQKCTICLLKNTSGGNKLPLCREAIQIIKLEQNTKLLEQILELLGQLQYALIYIPINSLLPLPVITEIAHIIDC